VDLSVIAPLYNEEDNVALLHAAIVAAVRPLGLSTEIILVDDGSRDQTFARALELPRHDPPLRLVKLRRNAGQTAAMVAGIDHARGRVLLTMDGDLQNDPATYPSSWRRSARDTISSWAGGKIGRTTGLACCPPKSRTG
jgi:glycosyltransferase involved in cell wall biosynthesis